jgi:hypothetical protein
VLDVGSLVGISKTFLDSFSLLKEVLATRKSGAEQAAERALLAMKDKINEFQSRLEGLAIQLEQSERLTRQIPAWEAYANQIPIGVDLSTVSDPEAQKIHSALRQLIDSSIRDQFSGTFFRTDFDDLPDMRRRLDIFRVNLTNLDRTISTIPGGNAQVFRALWPNILVEFNNLRNSGYDVRRHAEEIHGDLINELLRSSQEARKTLSQV